MLNKTIEDNIGFYSHTKFDLCQFFSVREEVLEARVQSILVGLVGNG